MSAICRFNPILQGLRALNATGEHLVNQLTVFQRVAEYAIGLFMPTHSSGILASPNAIGRILSEHCSKREHIYQVIKNALIGTSVLGAGGAAIACIAGVPGVIFWTSLLAVTSVAGAITAGQAARHYAESRNLDEMRRQTEEMGRRNLELARQTTILTAQNATLTVNVTRFTAENVTLRANVNRLTNQVTALQGNITQFAIQNEGYRRIAEQFRIYIEQFRAGNVQNQGEFTRRLEELTQQMAASRQLWDQIAGDQANQMTQLRELVAQLADPRNTLLRLQEHQEINRQIQDATTRLGDLGVQIALRDGQLRERDQFLMELRAAHQGILECYGQHNNTFGSRNEALEAQINRFCLQLNRYVRT